MAYIKPTVGRACLPREGTLNCSKSTALGTLIAEASPTALIRREIEPHVVEVHGPGRAAWATAASALADRVETVGETTFAYCRDPGPLLGSLAAHDDVRTLHRPANLEDVFLKLTGRDLRD